MRYNVTTHALLAPDARKLSPESLRQHNELAEELLGLLDVAEVTDPAKLDRVRRGVVRQLNWQVLLDPDALMLKSKTVGTESETYRDNIGPVDEMAKQMIETALGINVDQPPQGGWEPIVSKR